MAAMVALQALRDHGHVRAGQTVLINGALGRHRNLRRTDREGARRRGDRRVPAHGTWAFVRSIGADHVIDYTKEDFTPGRPALRLHPRQRREPLAVRDSPRGAHADRVAGAERRQLPESLVRRGVAACSLRTSWPVSPASPSHPFLVSQNQADLIALKDLIEAGKVTPVIDRAYPLSETAQAIDHVGLGHARGKVAITSARRGSPACSCWGSSTSASSRWSPSWWPALMAHRERPCGARTSPPAPPLRDGHRSWMPPDRRRQHGRHPPLRKRGINHGRDHASMAGKNVLITGGSAGIGRGHGRRARRAWAPGWPSPAGTGTRRGRRVEIRAATATRTSDAFGADLSSQAEVRRLAAAVLDAYPRLDVLVNNVGGSGPPATSPPMGWSTPSP